MLDFFRSTTVGVELKHGASSRSARGGVGGANDFETSVRAEWGPTRSRPTAFNRKTKQKCSKYVQPCPMDTVFIDILERLLLTQILFVYPFSWHLEPRFCFQLGRTTAEHH